MFFKCLEALIITLLAYLMRSGCLLTKYTICYMVDIPSSNPKIKRKKMQQKKKSILIICPFPQGVAAGQRLKYEQYLKHWRENGYAVTISSFMDMSMWEVVYTQGNYLPKVLGTLRGHCRRIRDVFRINRYDLVYIFMWVTPFGSSFFERLYRLLSRRLIYDIEDNIFMKQNSVVNPFVKMLKGTGKASYLIKTADHVITSSPFS